MVLSEARNGSGGKQKQNYKDPKSTAPSVTITAPDGKVKTLVPSKRQQQHLIRLISSILFLEFVICALMITFESVVLKILNPKSIPVRLSSYSSSSSGDSYHYYIRTCRIGAGIWSGLIGFLCVGIGIALALARMNCIHTCNSRIGILKVIYAAAGFLCAIVDAILVASVSMCIYGLNRASRAAERKINAEKKASGGIWVNSDAADALQMFQTALSMDTGLIALAVIHVIVTVASIKILRRGWSEETYQSQDQEKPRLQTLDNDQSTKHSHVQEKTTPKNSCQVELDRVSEAQFVRRL